MEPGSPFKSTLKTFLLNLLKLIMRVIAFVFIGMGSSWMTAAGVYLALILNNSHIKKHFLP